MFKQHFAAVALALSVLPLAAGATTTTYAINLSGLQEVPANGSAAAGSFQLTVNDVADTLTFALAAFNLSGAPTASHIHFAPAGSNGGIAYDLLGNADSSGPVMIGPFAVPGSFGYVGSNKPAGGSLADMINAAPWNYYVNLHSQAFPGGEIRGQLAPVPEPGTYALLAIGLGVVGVAARRRRAG